MLVKPSENHFAYVNSSLPFHLGQVKGLLENDSKPPEALRKPLARNCSDSGGLLEVEMRHIIHWDILSIGMGYHGIF